MKDLLVSSPYFVNTENIEFKKLMEMIIDKFDTEILGKQNTIERLEQETKSLQTLLEARNKIIEELNKKLTEIENSAEGSRQLINKLLSDNDRLHQDIEWYKKTYEKRSLLGTIKEKIFRSK